MPPDAIKTIARGKTPVWEHTFDHPEHGELTFKAELPNALKLAAQSVEIDNLLAELQGEPRNATLMLVAAIAGLKTIAELPVIDERREESDDEDEPDHVKIIRVFYDPEQETDETFLTTVWLTFSNWRQDLIGRVDELGNSSGGTRGSDSSESSTEPTGSPQETPA